MSDRLPNFLHLGPSKSGSTWLHEVLICHPEIYLSRAKDLYFFSRYYDRGADWYRAQFADVRPAHKIIGEISPDYLWHPDAPERIRACLGPDVRLMVTLREPASRAFSAYLYLRKHGQARPTFRETAQTAPDVLGEGRYATHLRAYLSHFDRERLHVSLFDDLQADPESFLHDATDWLGLSRQQVSPDLLQPRLQASNPRWLPLATLAKAGANWVRSHDGANLVGRVKRAAIVQRSLYKPMGSDRPTMSEDDICFVREQLEKEIIGVEEEFGIPLRERWGWR